MRAEKCGWTIAAYNNNGDVNEQIIPHYDIFIPEESGEIKAIARYSPLEAREYLGVLQTLSSDDSFQLTDMHNKVTSWNTTISQSRLPTLYNLAAFHNRITKLFFPTRCRVDCV